MPATTKLAKTEVIMLSSIPAAGEGIAAMTEAGGLMQLTRAAGLTYWGLDNTQAALTFRDTYTSRAVASLTGSREAGELTNMALGIGMTVWTPSASGLTLPDEAPSLSLNAFRSESLARATPFASYEPAEPMLGQFASPETSLAPNVNSTTSPLQTATGSFTLGAGVPIGEPPAAGLTLNTATPSSIGPTAASLDFGNAVPTLNSAGSLLQATSPPISLNSAVPPSLSSGTASAPLNPAISSSLPSTGLSISRADPTLSLQQSLDFGTSGMSYLGGKPLNAPLPAFDGKTTLGALFTDEGQIVQLRSGNTDPAYGNYAAAGHVEGKAAIWIRENDSSGGIVYHNNTGGTCGFCDAQIETLLPENSILRALPPANATPKNPYAHAEPTSYQGNSSMPKPNPRFRQNDPQ